MSFSILAVGSFPQTRSSYANSSRRDILSVSSLLDRFLRPFRRQPVRRRSELSVSSLLDRFLRHRQRAEAPVRLGPFSILAVGSFPQTQHANVRTTATNPSFSILAVGSFPQTRQFAAAAAKLTPFSILAVGSFPQTASVAETNAREGRLSVSSLLDRFLRRQSFAAP